MALLIEAAGGRYTLTRDCLLLRDILNSHIAQYTAEQLSTYMRLITELKRLYREHAAARKAKSALARLRRERKF
jgi:hypothetical protein